MILIADSGSTKTDWCLTASEAFPLRMSTQGINPFFQTDEQICGILFDELLPQIPPVSVDLIKEVHFYGAGIRPEMRERMNGILSKAFPKTNIKVESDLLGAAHALFGHGEGIACILGTGSNSGLYDGQSIIANTPPLGFILGDEGSGAVLGKLFLGSLCKGLMPNGLLEDYLKETQQEVSDIIQAVYRQPLPNRYLARASRFIHSHIHVEEVRKLVVDNFRAFFKRNIVQYGRRDLPVGAIGSVAWYYQEELKEAAQMEGFLVDRVLQSPMEGLVRFVSL
ncbi:MAG: ATPase [Prevotella sp.]|nr:ATPase [Prevotella sp.]